MDRDQLNDICEQIYRKYPEVAGKQPKLQPQPSENTLLIFSGTAAAADGRKINRTVRVIVNRSGKITRVTTSK